ncbi:hypothetical protein JYT20_01440, partial [Rhodothermus sp. AH-315-K08]|nr:hypothetical protein [Rhodothermus sp. AH-315-K08]
SEPALDGAPWTERVGAGGPHTNLEHVEYADGFHLSAGRDGSRAVASRGPIALWVCVRKVGQCFRAGKNLFNHIPMES